MSYNSLDKIKLMKKQFVIMPKGIAISLRRFAPTYGCVQHTQGVVVRAVTCTSIAPEVAGKKKKKWDTKRLYIKCAE